MRRTSAIQPSTLLLQHCSSSQSKQHLSFQASLMSSAAVVLSLAPEHDANRQYIRHKGGNSIGLHPISKNKVGHRNCRCHFTEGHDDFDRGNGICDLRKDFSDF